MDREALRRFLACLLAKSPEQRALLDQRFDTWCPDQDAAWESAPAAPRALPTVAAAPAEQAEQAEAGPFERPEPVSPRLPWLPAAGLAAALILAGTLVYLLLRPPPRTEPAPDTLQTEEAVPLPELPDTGDGLPANPALRVWYWRAEILGVEAPYRLMAEELALTAFLAGLLAGGLWWRYRRRTPPPPRLPPTAAGPAWMPLAPVTGSDTALTGPRERRGLVWNIGRFVAEDRTRRLDEPATVAATVRSGGLANIRYRHARFPREVWLWLDEHGDDPAMDRLAAEIAGSLARAGLRVRRGSFAGTLVRVWWRRDDHFEPTRMEGHRPHAMVALLTDGLGLARALGSPLRGSHVARLLRQLRLWPHLALVDFGPSGRLARLVRPYGLDVVRPQDLVGWLGGKEGAERPSLGAELQGDRRLWAAACCLGADPPDPTSAQRLRRCLSPRLDAWAIRDLQRDADAPGLRWPEPRRRALVNGLLRAGPLDELGIPAAKSPAALAIGWWRARYRSESRRQGRRHSRLLPWKGTPAQREWDLEDALLTLYLEPGRAVQRLRALAAAAGAAYRWLSPPGIELAAAEPIHDAPALRAQSLRLVDDRRGRVALGHGKGAVTARVQRGGRVSVAWAWGPPDGGPDGAGGEDNNPVRLREGGAALVFRAGTLAQPIRPCGDDWPARSLAVVRGDPQDKPARRLAIRLLDSGTADRVLRRVDRLLPMKSSRLPRCFHIGTPRRTRLLRDHE